MGVPPISQLPSTLDSSPLDPRPMSTQAEIACIVGSCILGLIVPADTNQVFFISGIGAILGSMVISLLTTTKQLPKKDRAARWIVNFCCGASLGPLFGSFLTDVLPGILVPVIMLASGFVLGAIGVALGMLLWSITKKVLPTALKSVFTSIFANLLNALNSNQNARPDSPDASRNRSPQKGD